MAIDEASHDFGDAGAVDGIADRDFVGGRYQAGEVDFFLNRVAVGLHVFREFLRDVFGVACS